MRILITSVAVVLVTACGNNNILEYDLSPAQTGASDYTSQAQIEYFDSKTLGSSLRNNNPRNISSLGYQVIMDFEGWEPQAYDDPSGYCTIGYGHLISKKKCEETELGKFDGVLTHEQGLLLLEEDTKFVRAYVEELVEHRLDSSQFDAVVSFTYNVGVNNFRISTLRKRINAKRYSDASREFLKWVYSKGVKLPGLITRRRCESVIFSGEIPPSTGVFSRALCATSVLAAAGEPLEFYDIETGGLVE